MIRLLNGAKYFTICASRIFEWYFAKRTRNWHRMAKIDAAKSSHVFRIFHDTFTI